MISIFIFFVAAQCCALMWATYEVGQFLRKHSAIDGQQALEAFKILARRNMRGALILLASGVVSLIIAIAGLKAYGSFGLLVVLGAYFVHGVLAINLTRLERRARTLKSSDETLHLVHQSVGQSWRKKMFPDF